VDKPARNGGVRPSSGAINRSGPLVTALVTKERRKQRRRISGAGKGFSGQAQVVNVARSRIGDNPSRMELSGKGKLDGRFQGGTIFRNFAGSSNPYEMRFEDLA